MIDAPYAFAEQLEPGIARLLARNPSPFTYFGTQTYFLGERELVVVDPGPALPEHVDAIIAALDGRPVAAIACTHTHRDHSPASRALKDRTGAPIIGCAPLALEGIGPRADASFDREYSADVVLQDRQSIDFDDGKSLVAVATPGHTSNHLCFAFGDALLTGDHVMAWSTTVVVPPDGDMAAYMQSLNLLRERSDRIFYPAHGPAVTKPAQLVRGMIGHRMQRERQILRLLGEKPRDVPDIVANAYPGLDQRLVPAAGGSVLAHLVDLQRRGVVDEGEGEIWMMLPRHD
ncbi:MBL fold metallo-hydrolase [Sphingomonas edaphi]|uniref:MBL fold metallo-hydrolase n=1 Tax=Sphingomonas edaphi TaxID=2315689 RepID=A0A418Q2B5_9SPHN|nr:MBL fold metallo-hydrolase [Sphingomonas edaphi]RIX31953.1 MBL fold metallo-hydrolase [Sphingomonas edaphi]